MLNPLLNELKLIAKSRGTKDYKTMSKERLVSDLSESESVQSKNSFDDERLKKNTISNELRNRFSKPRRLSNFQRLSNLNKYLYQDDFRNKNMRDIRNLINQSIDEDYYRPIITKSVLIVITSNIKAKRTKTKFIT